jgi:hypothetical protein
MGGVNRRWTGGWEDGLWRRVGSVDEWIRRKE